MVFLAVSHLAKSAQKGQEANENEGESFSLSELKSTDGLGCRDPAKFRVEPKKSDPSGHRDFERQ